MCQFSFITVVFRATLCGILTLLGIRLQHKTPKACDKSRKNGKSVAYVCVCLRLITLKFLFICIFVPDASRPNAIIADFFFLILIFYFLLLNLMRVALITATK